MTNGPTANSSLDSEQIMSEKPAMAAHARMDLDNETTLTHQKNLGLLMLRASASSMELEARLQANYRLCLPSTLSSQSVDRSGNRLCIRWLAPDAWLLSGPLENVAQMQGCLSSGNSEANGDNPSHIAVVDVSGGYRCFHLQGKHCNTILKKSTSYDVHPLNFPPGKVVNTVFAKTQLTMRCIDPDHVELIVRLSYADYLLRWLARAGEEFALSVKDQY